MSRAVRDFGESLGWKIITAVMAENSNRKLPSIEKSSSFMTPEVR